MTGGSTVLKSRVRRFAGWIRALDLPRPPSHRISNGIEVINTMTTYAPKACSRWFVSARLIAVSFDRSTLTSS